MGVMTVRFLARSLQQVLVFLGIIAGVWSANASDQYGAPVFVLASDGLITIAPDYLEFLEGLDHTASPDRLAGAVWTKKLVKDQSLVDGYWVRFRVKNSLATDKIGIEHNFNTEKKLLVVHKGGLDEYAYWKRGRIPG